MKWPFRLGKRPAPIRSEANLADFLDQETAYLAQKSATDYCWAKAGLNAQKLFSEPAFQAALAVCRWEGYVAMLGNAIVLTEGRLRDASVDSQLDPQVFVRLFASILRRYAPPAHLQGGWEPEIEAFAARLARVRLAEPARADQVAKAGVERLFAALPINNELRRNDFDVVLNSVRFGFVAFAGKLDERLDRQAVAADLGASG